MGRFRKTLSLRKVDSLVTNPTMSPPPSACAESAHEVAQVLPEHTADALVDDIAQESAPVMLSLPTPLSAWQICGDTVIGLAHRRKGLPCQDAVAFRNSSRPILALSDGAGSSPISERGAQALVIGITRLLLSMEDDLSSWLDGDDKAWKTQMERWSERLRLHAQGLLVDLAQAERRNVRDVRATLLVAVVGKCHVFWWKVGDGAIVAMNSEGMWSLGNQASAKGEFANQTCFVDTAVASDVQFGLLSAREVFGIALMSDGGAEKLVAHDGSKVANRLGEWLNAVAEQKFAIDRIALAFHEPAMWERTSLDDRSIVLAARPK
jgi:hypothetical protein